MDMNLNYEIVSKDIKPEGFLMVLGSDRKTYWKAGLSDFESLYEHFGLEPTEQLLNIFIVIRNDEKYPYVFPNTGMWSVCTDHIPAWFDDECRKITGDCFLQWYEYVYSIFDYKGAGSVCERINSIVAAAPDQNYQVTEEDIEMFNEYARCRFKRDDMYDVIVEELGFSLGDNAYCYLKENFGDVLKHELGAAPLLRSMGITNTGGTQENFYGACIAGYFAIKNKKWERFAKVIDLANQFIAKGMSFTNASDQMNRIHSYKGGAILYTAPASDASDDHAFSCIVDRAGTVYWKLGIDNYITLREIFELDSNESAAFKVEPELNGQPESYILPDGLNPEVNRHFIFLEENAVKWVIKSLDKGGKPVWVDASMEDAIMDAQAKWHDEAFRHFDREALWSFFDPDNIRTSYGSEEISLLKDYVRSLKRPGPPARIAFMEMVAETIGQTLADTVDEWIGSKWRMAHTDCPQPCMKIGYCTFKGFDTFNNPSQRIEDTFPFIAASHFLRNINWHTDDGSCPFESAAELMRRGYVVFSDFENWYLASGAQCDVLLEISEDELLG